LIVKNKIENCCFMVSLEMVHSVEIQRHLTVRFSQVLPARWQCFQPARSTGRPH
jgi:hypothetical protein